MSIFGTTNIHDFESKVTEINACLRIKDSTKIEILKIEVPVKSIKSGNKTMDSKTYQAFDTDKHPKITFELKDLATTAINNKLDIATSGILTMAGKTKLIQIKTTAKKTSPGNYCCTGKVVVNMTDFEMTPPTAFVGLMRVGEMVVINYQLDFKEE